MMNHEPRRTVLFLRGVPTDLRDQFKSWCAKRGVTMTATIRLLMRETLKDHKVIIEAVRNESLRKQRCRHLQTREWE